MTVAHSVAIPGSTISRQVVWLATPILVEQALLYLVGLSDTVLTAYYLTAEHLAAVTVAGYLLWFLSSVLTLVSVGATALVARMIGSNQRDVAIRITQQAMAMALGLGTLILLVGWILAPTVMAWLNLTGEAARAAVVFFRIILVVTPLLACTVVGVACLRGAGDTRTGMLVMTVVNLVNIGLSWGLVRGFGPLPELGFPGVALGTAIGEGIGGVIVLVVLGVGRSGLKLTWLGLIPARAEIWRILRISIPAAGESLTNVFGQLWFLSMINQLGAVATAAHGVAIRCEAIAFLTVTAFAVAASTLTGQYLGAERPDLASRAARSAWGLGCLVLSALGVLLYVEAGPMFELFLRGRQPEVAEAGVPVLRIVAFALPSLATINVLNGALRGSGDTRWPWVFSLIGYLGVRLPLTYWFIVPGAPGGLGLGLRGAWWAMFADLTVRSILVAGRFLHGGWRYARV